MRRIIVTFLICSLLVACTAEQQEDTVTIKAEMPTPLLPTEVVEATATALPTLPPTAEPVVEPTATISAENTVVVEPTAMPTAMPTATEMAISMGRTADGAFYIGRQDAELTIIDYSDFL